MTIHWTIEVINAAKIKGKPANWMPNANALAESGVPISVARRWQRIRRDMTVGLKRRTKQNVN